MAQITPAMVKELREKTGAGMGDCKKALTETDGNMQEAIEYLRKKGAASAAKRADKSANEGTIFAGASEDGKKAAIVEINCETDFVAMNEQFTDFVNKVGNALINNEVSNNDELMKLSVDGDTVEGMYNEILAKFSEKVEVNRFKQITSDGFIASYIHAGNKLGVLVDTNAANINDEAHAKIRDIAMQIAAMNPMFVDRSEVDQSVLEKEKEIYRTQAIESGKKEEIADRIAQGRLEKFYTENCLVEQSFVKDSNMTITDVLKEISELVGSEVKINKFIRYALGESED